MGIRLEAAVLLIALTLPSRCVQFAGTARSSVKEVPEGPGAQQLGGPAVEELLKASEGPMAEPGCLVRKPRGCPLHPQFNSTAWNHAERTEKFRRAKWNRTACEVDVKDSLARWCGTTEIEVLFVPQGSPNKRLRTMAGMAGQENLEAGAAAAVATAAVAQGSTEEGGTKVDVESRRPEEIAQEAAVEERGEKETSVAERSEEEKETPMHAEDPTQKAVQESAWAGRSADDEHQNNGVSAVPDASAAKGSEQEETRADAENRKTESRAEAGSDVQVPVEPGCFVRKLRGCPNHPSYNSTQWTRATKAERTTQAKVNRTVCEVHVKANFSIWCGTQEIEVLFIPTPGAAGAAAPDYELTRATEVATFTLTPEPELARAPEAATFTLTPEPELTRAPDGAAYTITPEPERTRAPESAGGTNTPEPEPFRAPGAASTTSPESELPRAPEAVITPEPELTWARDAAGGTTTTESEPVQAPEAAGATTPESEPSLAPEAATFTLTPEPELTRAPEAATFTLTPEPELTRPPEAEGFTITPAPELTRAREAAGGTTTTEAEQATYWVTDAGCFVNTPSGCPNHPSFSGIDWRHDDYGERYTGAAENRSECEVSRKAHVAHWCGVEDVEMLFIPRAGPPPSTGRDGAARRSSEAAPAEPGCFVRTPNGCPNHPNFHSFEWKHEEFGEMYARAQLNRTMCEVTRQMHVSHWCGVEEVEMIFVPQPRPGCYVSTPSGCPKHPSFSSIWWQHEDKPACEVKRKANINKWCGIEDAQIKFVEDMEETQQEDTTRAASSPGPLP